MKIGFYPGCSLTGTSQEYNESLVAVAGHCGIQLQELDDWSCCGASSAHALNHTLAIALPARIIAIAEQQGFSEMLIPCAACFSRIATAQYELQKNPELLQKVNEIIGTPLKNTVKLINPIDFLSNILLPLVPGKITQKLKMKVACYYGCLLVRPQKIAKTPRFEDPLIMEDIITKCGGVPVEWNFKTECCGASLSITRDDISANLSAKILSDATWKKAEVIAVACPMCHSNLDMRRPEINRVLKNENNVPVLFITQLIGLALGISEEKLGLQRIFVPYFHKKTVAAPAPAAKVPATVKAAV